MDFKEYHRIYQKIFTQYFPHEHFDRFLMHRCELGGRGLYEYLETDIVNLAELLTRVQMNWMANIGKTEIEAVQNRHDTLVMLGYTLHTVEDYWAHTNYVDFAMEKLKTKIENPDDLRRHQLRLLRNVTPRIEPETNPGPTQKESHVVGGYFDSLDTRFSLKQIFDNAEEAMGGEKTTQYGVLLNHCKYRTPEEREAYLKKLSLGQTVMNMPQEVRDAQLAYIKIDWGLIDEKKTEEAAVASIIADMIKEGEEKKKKYFTDEDKTLYTERVGSHTLIAKDDKTKSPGFDQAMWLAKFVDKYIIETMIGVAKGTVNFTGATQADASSYVINQCVDWLDLLQYFLWHPDPQQYNFKPPAPPDDWWEQVLNSKGKSGKHLHVVKPVAFEIRNARYQLMTRKSLEMEHNSMIAIEESKYETWYNSQDGSSTDSIEKQNPTSGGFKKGEKKEYLQEDVDTGVVRIVCKSGSLKISLYAAVWSSFDFITEKNMKKGDVWNGKFTELSSVFDQDNKAVVEILEDGTDFDIQMSSTDR
jgi:hypothetical protein